MSNPRNRNLVRQGSASTSPARLSSVPSVPTGLDLALNLFLSAVKERLEVREGERGNPWERTVTRRDLVDLGLQGGSLSLDPGSGAVNGLMVRNPDGSFASISVDAFAQSLMQTQLYQDLVRRLDDPNRFDNLAQEVKDVLLSSLSDEAARLGANISRVERTIQTDVRSLAMVVETVTAASQNATAGVRDVTFAQAELNKAVAGKTTQINARLNDFGGSGATIETTMTASASRISGLAAEWMVKMSVNKYAVGFGIAATEDPLGHNQSAFIVQADKFAVIGTSDSLPDPLNPPSARIPFGIDTVNNTVYINGQVRINSNGTRLDSVAKKISLTAPTNVFLIDQFGAHTPSSIVLTATLANGLTGTVTWSITNGTATLTGSGSTRTLTFSNMATDQVTVRASVTDTGVTYTDDFVLSKTYNGTRGSVTGYGTTYGIVNTVWDATYANRVISNILNSASLTTALLSTALNAIGDTVTLSNSTPWLVTSGTWSSTTQYYIGQIVISSGVAYRAVQASLNQAVTSTAYWAVYQSAVVSRGAWAASTAYALNDIVTALDAASVSQTWLCLYPHTSDATAFATDRDRSGFSETRYWTGTSWLRPGVTIDGNLLVAGTVTADQLNVRGANGIALISGSNVGRITYSSSILAIQANAVNGQLQLKAFNQGGLTVQDFSGITNQTSLIAFPPSSGGTVLFQTALADSLSITGGNSLTLWGGLLGGSSINMKAASFTFPGTAKLVTTTHTIDIGATGTGAATGTAVLTGKPGTSTNSQWAQITIDGTVYDMLVWPR